MPDSVLDAEPSRSEEPTPETPPQTTPPPEPSEAAHGEVTAGPAVEPAAAQAEPAAVQAEQAEPGAAPADGAAEAEPAADSGVSAEPGSAAEPTTPAAQPEEPATATPTAPSTEEAAPAEATDKAEAAEKTEAPEKIEPAEKIETAEKTGAAADAGSADRAEAAETAGAAPETEPAEKVEAAEATDAAPETEPAGKVEAAGTTDAADAKAADETEAADKTETAGKPEAADTAEAADKAEPAEEVEESEEVKALRAAKESGETVKGKVIGWNRGGFHVALDNGVTAFCPNSEMETGRPKTAASYVDQELEFQVIKVQRRGRRVVLSRASLVKEQREKLAAETRAKLQVGAVLPGRVSSVTDFGAFVDLGGIEGLVHVSEISRKRVGHAKQAVQVGQEVEVKVLKIEKAGDRISLSMKALEPDPWSGVAERFPAGSEFTGKVVRKTDFGLFVELEPDVDGLVHLSRLPHGVGIDDESLEVGKEISGWVQEVDTRRGRVSLSLREVPQDDPWKGIEEKIPEGSVVEGTVESVAPFGVFINLQPGLTGLLPGSETGVPRGANAARQYPPGKTVSVQVVTVDRRRKRISLAREGTAIEGSKADYQAYRQQQSSEQIGGLSAMASAFAKLRDGDSESESDSSD